MSSASQTPPDALDAPALEGVTVLELAQGVAAPYCGMLLAQNGAAVTKIEPPRGGDWSRGLGRRYGDLSADAIVLGRGKKSLCLDLKRDEGRMIARRLAEKADVILENYRPGVVERFGLDYESLRQHNPGLVYVSLTGFGREGPRSELPATDTVMQGYTGLMAINRDGEGVPRRLDMLAVDMAAGLFLFQAVSAALYRCLRHGIGKHIRTSLLECSLAFQEAKMVEFALTGGEHTAVGAPVGTFRTTDGYLSLNARRDNHFSALCDLLGRPEWRSDPRFAGEQTRLAHAGVLNGLVAEHIETRSTAQWSELFGAADILHAPVCDYADLFEDPQVAAVGAIQWVDTAGLGTLPMARIPGLPAAQKTSSFVQPPHVGEQGAAVLAELGLPQAEITRLNAEGIVGFHDGVDPA